MIISKEYIEQNRLLHESRPDYGTSGEKWAKYIDELIENVGFSTILDIGAGKQTLSKALPHRKIVDYDPAIPGLDVEPEPAELTICTDVLEHIEPVHLNAFLRFLKEKTQRRLFIVISTRPAGKTLADGRNAHLIVQPGAWWRARLLKYFQILAWEERGSVVAAELVAKKQMGYIKPAGRRIMTPPMRTYFDSLRDDINANSDTFSQIASVRMFEGIDDELADLQAAWDIIEHLDDIDAALGGLAANSLKCTFIAVKISALHSEWDWRRTLEKRFRVTQWQVDQGHLIMIGAPGVMIQGICAVGAVASDERWKNVEAAVQRFPDRIELSDVHERTAIIACYGPSLVDTIDLLKREAERPDVDVISVSGAHDFLLSHGIVPRYHIECDPRPHKADNIDKFHPDVTYMIASVVHEVYFNKLVADGASVKLWHVSTPEHALRLVGQLKENSKHVISGGGSVGLRSMPLLYAMGYRDMSVFAMDCSFKSEGENIQQWAGKHAGKKQDCCEVLCNGELFISSPVLLTYATNFWEMVQKVTDLNVRLYGHGLLQSMGRYYMAEPSSETNFMERIEYIDDEPMLEEKVA